MAENEFTGTASNNCNKPNVDMGMQSETIGSYKISNGAVISIETGEAANYAGMRAAQMRALAHIVNGEDFGDWSDEIQTNARWLLTTLAEEMAGLVPIIDKDAEQGTIARQNKIGGESSGRLQ